MSICTLNAARLVILEHRYIMWLTSSRDQRVATWALVVSMPRARDSAAMHHPKPAASAPALR